MGKTLLELVAEHPRVVFDTSILDATHAPEQTKKEYNDELELVLALTECYTVGGVLREARRVLRKPEQFYSQVDRRKLQLGDRTELFKDIRSKLINPARQFGVLNHKGYGSKMTDVEVVALTFMMSCGGPIALLSGDRDLLALANWQRRHAHTLKFQGANVNLYLFSPVTAQFSFINYEYGIEKAAIYDTDRRAV